MDIHCTAGVTTTRMIGKLKGYSTVWYHPGGIANIILLARVHEKGNIISYSSNCGNQFIVKKPDGTARIFQQSPNGLFYLDTDNIVSESVFITTVEDKKSNYTKKDYSQALLACRIQRMIGGPSTQQLLNIVDNNLLPNCPVNRQDILAAEDIFGPDLGILKGKTARHAPDSVKPNIVTVPMSIMKHYQDVILAGDIMFINKIPFFVTISRYIRFCTSESVKNMKNQTLFDAIKQVIRIYQTRGFRLIQILMDGQFESLHTDLRDQSIILNTTSNNEHVPEIERHIRKLKERSRSIFNTLPFKKSQTE
jgi:hypothetical protein